MSYTIEDWAKASPEPYHIDPAVQEELRVITQKIVDFAHQHNIPLVVIADSGCDAEKHLVFGGCNTMDPRRTGPEVLLCDALLNGGLEVGFSVVDLIAEACQERYSRPFLKVISND